MYGFSLVPDSTGIILVVAGIITGICFALYEMRIPAPVLDMRLLLNNRVFAFSNLAALIIYSATFAVMFLLSLDLQYTKGFSPEYAGLILIIQTGDHGMLSRPLPDGSPTGSTRRSLHQQEWGLLSSASSCSASFRNRLPCGIYLLSLVVCGIGFGLFSSPNTNAIMSSVEKRYYGVASGMNGTMRIVGQMLSMGIAMMIFSLHHRQGRDHTGVLSPVYRESPLCIRPLHDTLYLRDRRVTHAEEAEHGGRGSP